MHTPVAISLLSVLALLLSMSTNCNEVRRKKNGDEKWNKYFRGATVVYTIQGQA